MDRVRLSTKGRLVIPKQLRAALCLEVGDTLELTLEDGSLVLKPSADGFPLSRLHGLLADCDMITDLEVEHCAEFEPERPLGD